MNTFDLYYQFILEDFTEYIYTSEDTPYFQCELLVEEESYNIQISDNNIKPLIITVIKYDLPKKTIDNQTYMHINYLAETILTTINLYIDPSLRIRFNCHTIINSGEKAKLGLKIEKTSSSLNNIPLDTFVKFFKNTINNINDLKLIADAQKQSIPIQFRFLSLYKFLELNFKKNGRWTEQLDVFEDSITEEFKKLNLTNKKFSNFLHEIRDKCAHIKTNRDLIGITSLSYEDISIVEEFTAFLFNICIQYINEFKIQEDQSKIIFGMLPIHFDM